MVVVCFSLVKKRLDLLASMCCYCGSCLLVVVVVGCGCVFVVAC